MIFVILFAVCIACCALYAEVSALKTKIKGMEPLHDLNWKIERLQEENKHLKNSVKRLTDDNHRLSEAMHKWEILSYEKMTDMIFSAYMATKSPELSAPAIIESIEKRTKKPSVAQL